jgi:hypothetical protein
MDDATRRFLIGDPAAYDSPEQIKESTDKENAEVLRQRRLRQVEAAILETPMGREWLWGVLSDLKVFEVTIAVSGSPFEQGLWAGQSLAGQRMMRRFAAARPELFAQMLAENDV